DVEPAIRVVRPRARPAGRSEAVEPGERLGAADGESLENVLETAGGGTEPLPGLDPGPVWVVLGFELAEPSVPHELLDRDEVADDLGRRPLARGGRRLRSSPRRGREARRERRET